MGRSKKAPPKCTPAQPGSAPKARYDYQKLWANLKARQRQKKFYDKAKSQKEQNKTVKEEYFESILDYDVFILSFLFAVSVGESVNRRHFLSLILIKAVTGVGLAAQ